FQEFVVALIQLDAFASQVVEVNLVEALHVSVTSLLESAPVDPREIRLAPVALSVSDPLRTRGGVEHHFFGDAPEIDACPPQTPAFNYRNASAIVCGASGCGQTSATTTEHQ